MTNLFSDVKGSDKLESIIQLERLMPVMSAEQLHRFEKAIIGQSPLDFSDEEVEKLEARLAAHRWTLDARVDDAISKSLM